MPPRESSNPASSSDEESASEDESPDNQKQMNYKNIPALRNAREIALMAEERWLIEILKRTRQQRNALKVEALYYQGLKASLFAKHAADFGEASVGPQQPDLFTADDIELDPIPDPTYPDISPGLHQCLAPTQQSNILKNVQPFTVNEAEGPSNIEDFNILEGQCNEQELQHLSVVPEKKPETWDIEDPEYESEEEDALSRVNIDMSMLVGHSEGD